MITEPIRSAPVRWALLVLMKHSGLKQEGFKGYMRDSYVTYEQLLGELESDGYCYLENALWKITDKGIAALDSNEESKEIPRAMNDCGLIGGGDA